MQQEEYEISLVDLIFYLLGKWKSLIVLLAVCAVLVAGGHALLAGRGAEATASEAGSGSEPDLVTLGYMDMAYDIYSDIVALRERGDESNEVLDLIYAAVSDYSALMARLGSDDLEYYERVYLGAQDETDGSAQASRYVLAGLLLGLMLWGIIGVAEYLTGDSIRYAMELSEALGIDVLGRVEPAGGGPLAKLRDRYVNVAMPGYADTGKIASFLELRSEESIYLSGDPSDPDITALQKGLLEAGTRLKGEPFGLIESDSEALTAAKEAGSVILLVRIGYTSRGEVTRQVRTASLYDIPVAGAITLG